ncbi:transmembrane protein 2, partial [Elysia marginata]
VPTDGDVVDIDKCVLLDTDTANLGGITIQPTGSLVFEPGTGNKLKLRTKYIRVEGLLQIGSEQCRYEGKAVIELTGERGDHTDPDFGQKYIGVTNGGRLELHGERKMPWVKLDQTLHTLDSLADPYFDSKVSLVVISLVSLKKHIINFVRQPW